MERRSGKSPHAHEFAPGIIDPDVYKDLIENHPHFLAGDHKTPDGRAKIKASIDNLKRSLGRRPDKTDPSQERNTIKAFLTERAILTDLLLRGDIPPIPK